MKSIHATSRVLLSMLMALTLLVLNACGGGGSGGSAAPVTITSQPSSTSVVAGSAASFAVAATGDGLGYQWQLSTNGSTWTDVVGATAATHSIAAASAGSTGTQYRVIVSGTANSVTSSAATLTVTAAAVPPVITTQPADQAAVAGANVSFSVTATGTALTYQWQASSDGTIWTDVSGATNATLVLTAVAVSDSGTQFRVVVSSGTATVNSATALLTVTAAAAAPLISIQPLPASVVAPQTATFSVVATGNPAPSYQWQLSIDGGITYTDIALATSASYTTPATATTDSGKRFRVHVSNTSGDIFSAGVALTVSPAAVAPVITAQPLNQTVAAPLLATFVVAATGTPSPTYQWQFSTDGGVTFANINGATSAIYTTPATAPSDSGRQFRAVATNGAGSATSNAATLTIGSSTLAGFPDGVAVDSGGNVYVCEDVAFAGLQKVSPTGLVTTVAGSSFGGLVDGTGSAARFNTPSGAALDASGNVYMADSLNHAIRKITPAGVVTTIAGTGSRGFVNGTGTAASFSNPQGIALDGSGNLYVADTDNDAIRKITPAGVVSTVASSIDSPQGIAVASSGNLFVSTRALIRTITPLGVVSTFAGGGGTYDPILGRNTRFDDGIGTAASFYNPGPLAFDSAGNLYVSDQGNFAIRKISPVAAVTTFAGTGSGGFVDGAGRAASFNYPRGIAIDSAGNLYVGDILNKAIRKITPAGVVSTLAH